MKCKNCGHELVWFVGYVHAIKVEWDMCGNRQNKENNACCCEEAAPEVKNE